MLNDVYSLPFDSSRPEKLWGSQSVCREEGYLRELSDDGKRVILEFQEIIGKKVYSLEKGSWWMHDLIRDNKILGVENKEKGYTEYPFQQFSIYMYSGWSLIDVEEVILPRKTSIKLQNISRIYVFIAKPRAASPVLYKTPNLIYPSTYKKFLNWACKDKKLAKGIKILEVLNYNEAQQNYYFHNGPARKNIKTQADLDNYISEFKDWCTEEGKDFSTFRWSDPIPEIPITKEHVDEFMRNFGGDTFSVKP